MENNVKISLKRALRLKNKLVESVNILKTKVCGFNRITEVNNFRDNVRALFEELIITRNNLIALKAKIASASDPIRHLIVEMGELRDQLAFLHTINTDDGTVVEDSYRSTEPRTTKFKVEITYKEIEANIRTIQERIDVIQDSIDEFNVKTSIEIDMNNGHHDTGDGY